MATMNYTNITAFGGKPFTPIGTTVIYIIFGLVSVSGILGNSLVIYAIVKKLVQKTPFVILLLHLSITNVVMDVSIFPCVMLDIKDYIGVSLSVQRGICALMNNRVPFYAGAAANTVTLMYIAFVRLTTVACSSKFQKFVLSKRFVRVALAISWVFIIAALIPRCISHHIDVRQGICVPDSRKFNAQYNFFLVTIFWLIPLSFLIINLFTMVNFMWKKTELKQSAIIKGRKQVVTMLFALIMSYLVCKTPVYVYFMMAVAKYHKFTGDVYGKREKELVLQPALLIALCNTITDPILYAFMWKGFRSGFRQGFARDSSINKSPSNILKDRKPLTLTFNKEKSKPWKIPITNDDSPTSLKSLKSEMVGAPSSPNNSNANFNLCPGTPTSMKSEILTIF